MVRTVASAPDSGAGSAGLQPPAIPHGVASIRSVIGSVTVVHADGVAAQARVGDALVRDDRIETGLDGRVGITFEDGTAFNLSSNARLTLREFGYGPDRALTSARVRVSQGTFAFVGGEAARNGGLLIDTPFAIVRANPQCGAIGALTVAALTFVLLQDLKAAPAEDPFLLDDLITYKDLQHGTFEIVTKGNNQQTVVVDDPEVTVVVRPTPDGVSIEQVINTAADMANLLGASQDANSTYQVGQSDPFTTGSVPGGTQRASLGPPELSDGPSSGNNPIPPSPTPLPLLPQEGLGGGGGDGPAGPSGPPPVPPEPPAADIVIKTGATIAVDETDGEGVLGEVDPPGGALGQHTILGADLFSTTSTFGSSGPALVNATVYSLTLLKPGSGVVDTLTGEQVTLFNVNGVIEGHAGSAATDPLVFTLSIEPTTGDVTLTQYRAVVHDTPTIGDTSEPALLANDVVAVTVTATNSDGGTSQASANLNQVVQFLDDGPVAYAVAAETVLDDDAQTLFPGHDGGTGDVPNVTAVSGGAGSLFDAGADSERSVTFTEPAGLQAVYKDPTTGLALPEQLSYSTSTTEAGHTILTATGVDSGNTVFTLDIAPDGSYTFSLFEPLVQPSAGTSEEDLSLTIGFTVTDGDGDTAAGSLTVTVNDDTPVAHAVMAATVLDDDAQTLFSGSDGGTGDVPDIATVSGGAGTLFNAGADGLKAISFALPLGLQAIYKDPTTGLARQEAVGYTTETTEEGHTILTVTGVDSGNTVFTLDVAPDGSYTFTLSEPLVHSATGTTEEDLSITVGVTVTDGDGDTAAGSLTVTVNDDTPVAHAVTAATVLDDDAQTLFSGSDGGTGDVPNVTTALGGAGALFSAGADGLKSISFTPPEGLRAIYKDAVSGLVLQETLTYTTLMTAGHPVLVARGAESGNIVFTLDVRPDGSYTFTTFKPLVHPTIGTTEENLVVTIGFEVQDGDGDTATGSLTVYVNDDMPVAHAVTATALPGNDGGSGDTPHTATVSGGVGTLFSAGADGLRTITLAAPRGLQAIYTDADTGSAASEALIYTTTTTAGHPVLTARGVTSGNIVFTLDVAPDGSYIFTLYEPLVHTTGENHSITFDVFVTDGDGDAATGSLTVNIDDETSVAHAVTAATVLDAEAQMPVPGSTGETGWLPGTDGTGQVFVASPGADLILGGTGSGDVPLGDTVDYSSTHWSGVTVDLSTSFPQWTGGSGLDTLVGVENVIGTSQDDRLFGNGASNRLTGGAGDDVLVGRGGDDALAGGAGADHFRYLATTDGLDHILDFGAADVLEFSNADFGNLGTGTLASSHFVSGATEGTFSAAGPGFWYNTNDNTLYFDSNGNAGGGLVALAVLENGFALEHTDIKIV